MTRQQAKIPLALVGMLTAVAGLFVENRTLIWLAIGVLGIAMGIGRTSHHSRHGP